VRKINLLLALSMACAIGGNACAMGQPRPELTQCTVVGADKLPAEVGGEQAICSAIRAASREKAPGADYRVEVEVVSASALAARVTLKDGRTLPEQKMAVSDRQLNPGSIERFAAGIADALAGSAAQ
jgi:hypothetical protein